MCAHDDIVAGVNRRSFLKSVAGSVAVGAVAARHSTVGRAAIQPLGMLAARLAAAGRRLTAGATPAFTPEFVVADVALAPPRRFNEFSGDLSGRYIGALATAPAGPDDRVTPIVRAVLTNQRRDGRFGNESLAFTASEMGQPHMALLWGNGRLLVGLLEYLAAAP